MNNIIKDKKGFELKYGLFAIIGISMVVISIGVIVNDWANAYDQSMDLNIAGFDRLDEMAGVASGQRDQISPDDPEPGIDSEASTFRSVFGILSNIFSPFRVVFGQDGMLDMARKQLGLPNYILTGAITMMIIAIIFTLVAIIFRLGKS